MIEMHMMRADTSTVAELSTAPFAELARMLLLEGSDEAARKVATDNIPKLFGRSNHMSDNYQNECDRILSSISNAKESELFQSRMSLLRSLLDDDYPLTLREAQFHVSNSFLPGEQETTRYKPTPYKPMLKSQKTSKQSWLAAKALLGKLAAEGKANISYFNVMMEHLDTSEDMLQLLEVDMMHLAHISPDDESIRILARQLILEGADAKAICMIDRHIKGCTFDMEDINNTSSQFESEGNLTEYANILKRIGLLISDLNPKELAKQRLQWLERYHNQCSQEGAARRDRFFKLLKSNNALDTDHFNCAILRNKMLFSDTKRHCIDVDMPAAGLQPNPTSYLMLVQQMSLEGDKQAALDVVKVFQENCLSFLREHPNAELDVDMTLERMRSALDADPRYEMIMRRKHLTKFFLRESGPPNTTAAMECLQVFDRNGVATWGMLKEIFKRCASSTSMIATIRESCKLNISVGSGLHDYMVECLIKQLVIEGHLRAAYALCQHENEGIPTDLCYSSNSERPFDAGPVPQSEIYMWSKEVEDAERKYSHNSEGVGNNKIGKMKVLLQNIKLPRGKKIKIRNTRIRMLLKQSHERAMELYTCFASNRIASSGMFWSMVSTSQTSKEVENVIGVTVGDDFKSPINRIEARVMQQANDKLANLLNAEGKPVYDCAHHIDKTKHEGFHKMWENDIMKDSTKSFLGIHKHLLQRKREHSSKMSMGKYRSIFKEKMNGFKGIVRGIKARKIPPSEAKQLMLAEYYAWKSEIAKEDSDPRIMSIAAGQAHKLLAYPLRWCTSAVEIRDIIQTELHDEYALASVVSHELIQSSESQNNSTSTNQNRVCLDFDGTGNFEDVNEGLHNSTSSMAPSSPSQTFPIWPGPDPYVALMKWLILHSDYDGAKEVFTEMFELGMRTNLPEKVLEICEDADTLNRMRTSHMISWSHRGHKDSELARQYVHDMLDKLVESKEANVYQFTVAMKYCDTSAEMLDLIRGPMSELGIKPNMATYKELFKMLMREGQHEKAATILTREVPGSNRSEEKQSLLMWILEAKPTTKKAKRSMQKTQYVCLLRHAKEGTPEAQKRANDFYHNIMKSCYTANSVAQNIMLQWCTSSEEMVAWLLAEKADFKGGVVETVVKQMLLEGDVEAAVPYMNKVESGSAREKQKNQNFLHFVKNMNKIIEDDLKLDAERIAFVKGCIKRGTLLDKAKVHSLFEIWRQNGEIHEISEELQLLENSC
eukprot:g2471.t1